VVLTGTVEDAVQAQLRHLDVSARCGYSDFQFRFDIHEHSENVYSLKPRSAVCPRLHDFGVIFMTIFMPRAGKMRSQDEAEGGIF
jgi:hypothetical protein